MQKKKSALPISSQLFMFLSIYLLFFIILSPFSITGAGAANYEGFGSITNGALDAPGGYTTYHVTSLANSGAGTLRDAVSQDYRYIVFDIGGTIVLTGSLYIRSSYITIDGASAPSPGITLSLPSGGDFVIQGPVNDIIITNIRSDGNGVANDGFGMYGDGGFVENVIIDHCTFANAVDGVQDTRFGIRNVTYSWNLFKDNMKGGSFSDGMGRHGISVHHNVYANCVERIPKVKSEDDGTTTQFDLVNNVVYDWRWAGLQIEPYGLHLELHVTNNYYKAVNGADESSVFIRGGDSATGHQVNFEGNIFPPGETDDVDTDILPPPIEGWARVTTYDASTLGDTVVPCVGTHYPTQEEKELLNEISIAIGGQGGECSLVELSGDLNNDGTIDIQDVQCCIDHILGTQDWGSDADVNVDGKVDEGDVEEIINIILKE